MSAESLARIEISTWKSDAGEFDVLADMPGRDGTRHGYDDLLPRSVTLEVHGVGVLVAALGESAESRVLAPDGIRRKLPPHRKACKALDLVGRVRTAAVSGRSQASHGRLDFLLAHLGDVIASKEFADRPKDHEALPELREIARRQE